MVGCGRVGVGDRYHCPAESGWFHAGGESVCLLFRDSKEAGGWEWVVSEL